MTSEHADMVFKAITTVSILILWWRVRKLETKLDSIDLDSIDPPLGGPPRDATRPR
jgi:hypothetical protein